MEFTYETSGTNTYLVYEIKSTDNIDSMELGMLTNNKILGLAPTIFTQLDNTKYIKYNVSAKVSAKQFFSGAVNKKRLIGVFTGIVNALLSAEDYMLDINAILLDLEYIYADVSTCDTTLICLPIETKKQDINICAFFKNIVFSTQFDQTEDCGYVAKLINYLNGSSMFSLTEFKSILEDVSGDKLQAANQVANQVVQEIKQPIATPIAMQQAAQEPVVQPVLQQPSQPVQQPLPAAPTEKSKKKASNKSVEMPNSGMAMPGNAQQMAIPGGKDNVVMPNGTKKGGNTNVNNNANEKQMSMVGLLMHYSKENAAIYKAQKEAKKATKQNKTAQQPQQAMPMQQPVQQPQQVMPMQQPVQQPQQAMPMQQPVQQPVQQPQPVMAQQPEIVDFAAMVPPTANYGETTVLNAGAVAISQPRLIRKKNNETININKPVFRIGKEKSYVDYFIADNSAISRSHANIICKGDEYFVMDTNSTNHTYVNGMMIQSNQEIKIESGSKIRLANEEFEFLN